MSQPTFDPMRKRGSFSSWNGNKYPHVKLRGYYSDVISNQNADKTGVGLLMNKIFFFYRFRLNLKFNKVITEIPESTHSHLWDVHTEKNMPLSKIFLNIWNNI